ncbi:choline transporter-like protein 4 isoform X1 [Esox lucius]|uniref:choline transporter-like protein 4 isoform X1 n=1 Tax=Esox lucius TaxID=8010 RepID=UPI0009733481|nr:choline transporter-like protein 4 isoform X1 [Esox lucius]
MKIKETTKKQVDVEYGGPCDPYVSGKVRNRSCTDVICCLLFLTAIAGYMVVGVLAWLFGDPRHIFFPRNSNGRFCGSGTNRELPSMIYVDILKCATTTNVMAAALEGQQCPTTQLCVPDCPSQFWMLPPDAYEPGAEPKDFFQQKYCDPSLSLATTTWTVEEILDKELCPAFLVPSKPALGRCLPSLDALRRIPSDFILPGMTSVEETVSSIKSAMGSLTSGFNTKAIGVRIFEDLASTWHWILLGLVVAMLVSVVFLLLLRYVPVVLVWLLVAGVLVVGGYGIWYCHSEYNRFKTSKMKFGDLKFNSDISAYLQVKETWLVFLILLCVVEFMLVLVISGLRKRLSLAVALMEESSRAVGKLTSTLVYPMWTFVLVVVCVAYCVMTSLHLVTSGAPLYRVVSLSTSVAECGGIDGSEACQPQTFDASAYPGCPSVRCIFFKYSDTGVFQQNLAYLHVYNVLAFLWCVNFVIALGQCTLAGAFASYYWAFSKPAEIPPFALTRSFICSLRYHVGSLAFGAVALSCFQLLRLLLEYLDHKTQGSQGYVGRFLATCLRCCFWCLDYFLKYLNRNAYVMIAIYGENFGVSAKNAYSLLMRNIERVVLLDRMTEVFFFFAKLLIVGAVGVLAFFFFTGQIPLTSDTLQAKTLNYHWMPVLVRSPGFAVAKCSTHLSFALSSCLACVEGRRDVLTHLETR